MNVSTPSIKSVTLTIFTYFRHSLDVPLVYRGLDAGLSVDGEATGHAFWL